MGIHLTARPPLDAAAESVARSAMDPRLDDCGDPVGRRMVVVFAGGDFAGVRRTAEICSGERGDIGCDGWRRSLQAAEEIESPAAALPAGTALLVQSVAARQVFF